MRPGLHRSRAGFTLAEAAVTIAVVAIVLTVVLQALEGAKVTAAHTMFSKTARELGTTLLGEIESGRWQDEIESGIAATFEDEPDYEYEIVLGDDPFPDVPDWDPNDPNAPVDTYRMREEWREDNLDEDDEDSEEHEPFEKVKLRVTYPKIRQFPHQLTLERWVRWEQIYGKDEEEEAAAASQEAGEGQGSGGEPDQ